MRTPSVLLSRNNSARNLRLVLGPRQHRQHRAGAILLHLHRRGEDVQRPFGKCQIDDVADQLRIQVVQIRFQYGDFFLFARDCLAVRARDRMQFRASRRR